MGQEYRICIEVLENGFEVEVPDMDAMKKAQKSSKSDAPVYAGSYMKGYAAKSVKEVLALAKAALEKLPETAYDTAFEEAGAES